MVKPGDINQQQQFANDAVQAYKDTQAKKAETSKAIEDNAARFAKGGISSGMSTGNRVLDKLQQNKRERQPQNAQVSKAPKNIQSQPMYDRNGNRIIQGSGTFERRQRQAAGQDQSFQGPTGYDVGAVVNQVSQNNQARVPQGVQVSQNNRTGTLQNAQGAQTQAPGGFNLLSYRTNNRRFNNGMNYLNNTFAGKRVTLDDGTQVDASKYFQDRMAKVLAHSNNPKALMHYMRSIQEDMARRGVGNFDISGELLKGTGMTDRGMANVLFQNKAAILQQLQPTSGGNQKPVVNRKPVAGGNKKPVGSGSTKPAVSKEKMAENLAIKNKYAPTVSGSATNTGWIGSKYQKGSYGYAFDSEQFFNAKLKRFVTEHGGISNIRHDPNLLNQFKQLNNEHNYWSKQRQILMNKYRKNNGNPVDFITDTFMPEAWKKSDYHNQLMKQGLK